MELVHEFSVPVPVEQAWQVLTDVARIAPCLPGAGIDRERRGFLSMGDVSARLLEQFVRNLEANVLRVAPDGASSG